jgi:hypothetical protein
MAMTAEQKNFAKNVALWGLGGGFLGTIVAVGVSEPPSVGKALIGTAIGALAAGSTYGFFLRTGGEDATMLGLGQVRKPAWFHRGPGAGRGTFGVLPQPYRRRVRPGMTPGRFRGLGSMGATTVMDKGQCYSV